MNNYILTSQKTNYNNFFRNARIIIVCFIILVFSISIIQYVNYLQGQSCAVDLMKATSDEYDDFSGSYSELVKEMYSDLNLEFKYQEGFSIGGYTIDGYNNLDSVLAASDVDKALGESLSEKGYDCYSGSYYLTYTGILGYFESTFDNCVDGGLLCFGFIISISLGIILIILNLLYAKEKNKTICITDDSLICKNKDTTIKEFMINDIKTVELTSVKGLKIIGNSINYNIKLVENRAEIKDFIMQKLTDLSNQITNNVATPQNNANELKKFKDLLDSGVITQEEFDQKKKQLLGL